MPVPVIVPIAWFTEGGYAAHRVLDPEGLQARYEEWLQDAEAGEQELQRGGARCVRVVLDAQKLAGWCRTRGRKIDARARGEFAVWTFRRDSMH